VRDEANRSVLADERIQNLQNLVERARSVFGIETAEPFINEDGVKPDLAACTFDDIGKTEREGERSDKGLPLKA
jgi:hypothetical protein